ncbi:MAG: glycosyltransferase [Mariprofundaceae bacterium]|nr:glycosyltransferase [Mariprofundaceae bacterium]
MLINPVHELKKIEKPQFEWEATKNDPQFKVDSQFPTGWCEFVVVMNSDTVGQVTLYIGTPYNFTESSSVSLGMCKAGETIIKKFIYIPKKCKSLRFDPIDTTAKFSINCFNIRSIYNPIIFAHAIKRTFSLAKLVGVHQLRLRLADYLSRMMGVENSWYRSFFKLTPNSAIHNTAFFRGDLPPSESDRRYHEYIERTTLTKDQRTTMLSDLQKFAYTPLFSLVVPVYNVKENWLREMLESVLNQIYPHWELCLADDASTDPHVRKVLEEYQERDKRIKLIFRKENGHISKATNSALELSSGEFYCLMDNDDLISPEALFEFAKLLNHDSSIDMIYSDEDKITVDGKRYEPFFKPDWSPEYLESCMYTAHFACYRKSIADQTGWFRPECNGAQDYDFVLRFVEKAKNIQHVPKILYHWRAIPGSTATSMDSKDYVLGSAVKGLKDMTLRQGKRADVKVSAYPGCFNIRYHLDKSPLISIIIPTAGKKVKLRGKDVFLLENCILSVLNNSSYQNIEFVVIDNGDLDSSLINFLQTIDCKLITYFGDVNIAKKINMGAKEASGEYLLILNDDIEVIAQDWLEALLEQGQKEGVGVVGAKLLFEHGGLQHVGVSFCDGLPDHVRKNFPRHDPGYLFSTVAVRNWMAVTGACMLTPTEVFKKVGGYGEEFRINYNDIDYCLKVYSSGFRIVYTPHAELLHFESVSREAFVPNDEIDMFLKKWGKLTVNDPYYNEDALDSRPPDFFMRSK